MAVYSDADGYRDLKTVDILVSATGGAENSIWVRYDRMTDRIYLYNDAGKGFVKASCRPGTSGVLQNSQGMINCGSTLVSGMDNSLTVAWRILPKAAFADSSTPKKIKAKAVDKSGVTSGWDVKGRWTITP
jgi:hypothetical protein